MGSILLFRDIFQWFITFDDFIFNLNPSLDTTIANKGISVNTILISQTPLSQSFDFFLWKIQKPFIFLKFYSLLKIVNISNLALSILYFIIMLSVRPLTLQLSVFPLLFLQTAQVSWSLKVFTEYILPRINENL